MTFVRGNTPWNKGKTGLVETPETRAKKALSAKARFVKYGWPKREMGTIASHEAQKTLFKGAGNPFFGKKHTPETRYKISLSRKGKHAGAEHSRWQGGITGWQTKLRQSDAGKEFRRHVMQRDNYTCQACGQVGGKLVVDHELPFAYYPDLRFEILNGRVLCEPCHKKTPTFGGGAYAFAKEMQLV